MQQVLAFLVSLSSASLVSLSSAPLPSDASVISPVDTSYVVHVHATRDISFFPRDRALMRSQLMTIESGQTFECFLPPFSQVMEQTEESTMNNLSGEDQGQQQSDALVASGRAAVQRMRGQCYHYADTAIDFSTNLCRHYDYLCVS